MASITPNKRLLVGRVSTTLTNIHHWIFMKRKSITLSTNTNACLSHLHHLFFPQIRGLQRVPPLPCRKLHNHYDGKDSKPTVIPLGWKREEIISCLLQEFPLKISDSISIRWLFTFGYFYLIVEFFKFLKILFGPWTFVILGGESIWNSYISATKEV